MSRVIDRVALLDRMLVIWRAEPQMSAAAVACACEVSRSTVHRAVSELKELGSLEVVRVGAQTTYKVKRGVMGSIDRAIADIQGWQEPHDADEGLSCLLRRQAY